MSVLKYGKLVDGQVIYQSQNELYYNGKVYIPAPDKIMEEAGYMLVVDTPQPSSQWGATFTWQIQNNQIVKVWTLNPDPRTQADKRKSAYETRKCVTYNSTSLTVDEANKLVVEYECENRDMSELKSLIAAAKDAIRAEFPDANKASSVEEKVVATTTTKKKSTKKTTTTTTTTTTEAKEE